MADGVRIAWFRPPRRLGTISAHARAPWSVFVLPVLVALTMVVGALEGATPPPQGLAPGTLVGPGGTHFHTGLVSDSLNSFAPYQTSPGELWGAGSPVEQCNPCNLRSASGAPAGQSVQPGQEVNAATGDFSFSRQFSSIPTQGGNLGLTMSYDQDRGLNGGGIGSPFFGQGWQPSILPTEVTYSDAITHYNDVKINEPNGSQTLFYGNGPTSSTCTPITDFSSAYKYTVDDDYYGSTSTEFFCAPYRVDAQAAIDSDGYTAYYVQGGLSALYFSSTTGLPAMIGTVDGPGLVSWTYDETPGTGTCPSSTLLGTIHSCDVMGDSAGRTNTIVLGGPLNYQNATAMVIQIDDPIGLVYGWVWQASMVGPEPATIGLYAGGGTFTWWWGFGWSSSNNYQMTTVTNPDSNTQHIGYDSNAPPRVTSLTDFANAHTTTYSYANNCADGSGCLGLHDTQTTTVTYSDGEVDTDSYDEGLIDSNTYGHSGGPYSNVNYSWQYPTLQNNPVTETIAVENNAGQFPTWTVTTDYLGFLIGLSDPNGNSFSQTFSDSGSNNFEVQCWSAPVAYSQNQSCTSPPTGATIYSYSLTDGELLSVTDALGNVTRYGYYGTDSLCWVAPPTVTGTGYPCSNPPYGSPGSDPPNGANAYSYDVYGDLSNSYVAYGTTSQTTATTGYDADGEKTSSYPADAYAQGTNPGNPNVAYKTTYNNTNLHLMSVVAPLSRTTSYTYDNSGNILTETDPTGVTTDAYDTNGRVCWSHRGSAAVQNPPPCSTPPAASTGYYYNYDTSAIASTTNPDGNTTSYAYANLSYPLQPTKVQDPMSADIVYNTYDMEGDLCVTGPVAQSSCAWTSKDTYKTYDSLGNLLSSEDGLGNTTTYQYAVHQFPTKPTQARDALGDTFNYGYDADGNLTSEVDDNPSGSSVNSYSIGYDADGRRCYVNVTLTSASCTSVPNYLSDTKYAYDARNDLSAMYDYNGGGSTPWSSFSYDNSGNLASETNDNGQTVNYAYDVAGDLTCVGYPVSASTNCAGTAGTSNTIVGYGYDAAGRLGTTTDWLGYVTTYSYSTDGLSNLTKITYPSSTGESISYGYDSASNLTAANYVGPAVGTKSQSWGVNADSLFNTTSQLSGYNSTPTYDGVHNWIYKNTNGGATSASTYLYNSNGELASDTPPAKSAITYSYNADDQLTQRVNPNTGVTDTFAYNALGERCWQKSTNVSNPTCSSPPTSATSYAWSALSQLCWSGTTTSTNSCSSPPTGVTTYTYDGTGLRVAEKTGSTTTSFAWDAVSGGALPRLVSDGTFAYLYGPTLFGGSAPVEQINLSSSTAKFVSTIPSGIQLYFNSSGTLLTQSVYSTYGVQTNTYTAANPSHVASAFGFEGGYTDSSGLIYLNNRSYDPSSAQFLSVDPVVTSTAMPYGYAGDNPVNLSDPSGQFVAGPSPGDFCAPNGQDCQQSGPPSEMSPPPQSSPGASAVAVTLVCPAGDVLIQNWCYSRTASPSSPPDANAGGGMNSTSICQALPSLCTPPSAQRAAEDVAQEQAAAEASQLALDAIYRQAIKDYIRSAPYAPVENVSACVLEHIAVPEATAAVGAGVAERFGSAAAALSIKAISVVFFVGDYGYAMLHEC